MKTLTALFILSLFLPAVIAYELPSSTLFTAKDRVYAIDVDGEGILIGSADGYAYYLDKEGKLLWKYGVGSEIYSVHLTGSNAFLGSRDDYVYRLTRNGREESKFYMRGDVTGIRVLADKMYVTTGFKDHNDLYWGGIYAWTINGKPLWQYARLEKAAFSVDSNGKIIVVGTGWQKDKYYGTIEGYDTSGNLLFSYKVGDWVKNVRICNGLILGASYDGNLYALGSDGKLVWKYNAVNPIYSLDCDGKVIIAGTNDGTVHILDMEGRPLLKESIGVAPWAMKLDGRYIYVGTDSGELMRLDRGQKAKDELTKASKLLTQVESASGIELIPVREFLSSAEEKLNSGYYELAYDYAQQAYTKAEAAKEAWNAIKAAESAGDVSKALQAFKEGNYEQAKSLANEVLSSPAETSTPSQVETTTTVKRTTSVVVVEEKPNYIPYIAGGFLVLIVIVGLFTRARSKPKAPERAEGKDPLAKLFERYESVEKIGEGGFAVVYKAKRKDGKIVALKVPKSIDEGTGRSFIREVSNWLHLKHPNIVRLYEANVVPIPYIEMEYCEGSLERERKPMDVEKAAWIIFNTAEGLKYAHSRKIIHRDLKPSNVLLKNGIPKISDWGLSKFIGEEKAKTIVFTPYYASPEQIAPETFGDVDERSDIWQLGVIFYELVTGRRPFEGDSLSSLAQAITTKEPVKPSELNPGARKVEPVIMKMLAKRKEDRYQSVEELQRDLARILNMTYSKSLKESKTLGDIRRTTYYLTELLLINLKTSNAREAYKYASDLAFYVKGELKEEVQKLAEQIKFRLEEGLEIPPELIEKAEIIAHRIRVGL